MNLEKTDLIEISALGILSFFLYQINFLVFVFLVPLQIIFLRKGFRAFSIVSMILTVLVIIGAYFKVVKIGDKYIAELLATELILPLSFIFSLYFINDNSMLRYFKRRISRTLVFSSLFALISLFAVYLVFRNNEFKLYFLNEIEIFLSQIRDAFGDVQDFEINKMKMLFTIEGVKVSILRQFIFSYFVIVLFVLWISDLIHNKQRQVEKSALKGFYVSERFIWPFMLSWAGILFSVLYSKRFLLEYVCWNLGLIVLVLFALQGFSILAFYIAKSRLKQSNKKMIRVLVVLLLLWPGINLFFIIGYSLLGASEIWIKHRS